MTEMMNVEEARRRIPPEILEKLGDRYGSFQYLSSGATSSVFKADDKVLAKSVALKVLLLSETRELLRFQKEAQAASKLNHPNLLTAMDFNITHDNKAYIVMDFVEGESVEARVQREGALSLAEAVDISKQIARGMENAHQQRVVHRDLKTSNIMLSERDSKLHVTVIDFGLARLDQTSLLENRTVINGLIQGSPLYMSPEQAFGNPGDHRSDIYSLACIIFKMLSERTPFESSETVQLLQMHAQAEPPLLSSLARCTIPDELDRLVARMLVKDPDRRPQSMKEVFDLLSDLSDVPEAVALAAPARLSNWRWMVPLAVLSFIIVCSFSYKLLFADKVSAPVPIEKRPPPSFALLANERLTDEVTGYLAARTPDKLKDEDFRSLAQWEYGEGRDLSTLYSDDSIDDLETGKHRLGKKSRPNALSLHNVTGITGSGLAYIRDNNFVCLDLSGTRLNDDGYKTLGTLTSVNRLIFDDARTTDKQLQYIVSLPKLHTLSLARCAGITDNA